MKYLNVFGISLIMLALSGLIVSPVLAQKPGCQDSPYNFVLTYTLEFDTDDWSPGPHSYQMKVITLDSPFELELDPVYFVVSESASLYQGQVFLRFFGLTWIDGATFTIHPDQDTVMQLSFALEEYLTVKDREAFRDSIAIAFKWDNGEYITIPAGPITSICSVDNKGNFLRTWGGFWK